MELTLQKPVEPSSSTGPPPFFIYEEPEFDHSVLLHCVPSWEQQDQAAEVAVRLQLESHPARTLDPGRALLFVLPIFPYISFVADQCAGLSHVDRMNAAAAALSRSRWYRRSLGADHLLATNTFRLSTLKAFRGLLTNFTVAWFESPTAPRRGPGWLAAQAQALWRCTVVIPYIASPSCRQQLLARPTHACTESERISVFYQGSLSIQPPGSSTAQNSLKHTRNYLAQLVALPGARIVNVSRGGDGHGPNLDTARRARGGEVEMCRREESCATKLEFARRMLCADFCLVPKGDTPTSSRFYSSIACSCVR
jgi:hypothetical protein